MDASSLTSVTKPRISFLSVVNVLHSLKYIMLSSMQSIHLCCAKRLHQKHAPKTLGTSVTCETGTARARRAKVKMGIGLDEHNAIHT